MRRVIGRRHALEAADALIHLVVERLSIGNLLVTCLLRAATTVHTELHARCARARRCVQGEAGARSSRAVQAACEAHARSGAATAAGSRAESMFTMCSTC